MKEIKAIDALTKIFHIETYTGEDGNYELSSNDWGLNFNVRIREYTIFIQDGKGARCSIDSDEDVDTMCQEIVAFIGEVIKDESKNYTFKNRSQILAWPYNCNTNYVDYLRMAFDMNSEEDEFDYARRKRSVTNSRKSIKSGTDPNVNEDGTFTKEYIMDNPELFTQDVFDKYGISREDLLHKRYNVDSSIQGQERGIQAIMDEYGCTREEAIEIMNEGITSGCHGKAKKDEKKEIKSSAEMWEAGYQAFKNGEGYADYPTGLSNSEAEDWMSGWDYANREDKGELAENEQQVWSEDDEERLRGQFADENGLNLNEDEFPENEYNEWVHRGAVMYSSVNRNHKNVKALYS